MKSEPIRYPLSARTALPLMLLLIACSVKPDSRAPDVRELTIADIHTAFRRGRYTAEQLVTAYLRRIASLDEKINAVTVLNPRALEEARELDREFAETGDLRPLHGIPVIIKDNINTAGMLTTAGSLALRDFIPGQDAFLVHRLKEAGAVVIAKSNMAEWAFSPMHTESSTFGTTRNPYNTGYVPAGSSGGTAAAVAASLAAVGIGTDTGNSIRGPSSHCALAGIRSTIGLVSRSGIVPLYQRNDVAGPMCRSVEDAVRVLEVIAGYDPDDAITAHSRGNIPENGYRQFLRKDGLRGARIGVLRALSDNDPDEPIRELFGTALADLQSLGAEIVDPLEIPGFSDLAIDQWSSDFRMDIEDYLAAWVKRDTLKTLEDIIRAGTTSDYAAECLAFYAENSGREEHPEIPALDAWHDVRRVAFRRAIEDEMDRLRLDAVVYPTWSNIPAPIDSFRVQYKGDNNQVIAPHTGQPAITVPMGYAPGDLPAGIQFLGRMFDEPTLIRCAYAYEQHTGHRHPPRLR
ncbi:amidase [bacterium]|nr:amidase [bacterium]